MVVDGRPVRVEHAKGDREFDNWPSHLHLSDPSQGSVLLARHTGGQITDDEAREALSCFGAIEETAPVSVADQKLADLPEGRWVKFAYFQDCRDARYVWSFHPSSLP